MKSSNYMKREGLSRALDFLTSNSLEVGTLITDRHKQINKFVSTQYPGIDQIQCMAYF